MTLDRTQLAFLLGLLMRGYAPRVMTEKDIIEAIDFHVRRLHITTTTSELAAATRAALWIISQGFLDEHH